MNKFLKLAILPVAFLVAGTTSSCSVSPKEIALITDIGDIDDGSFNQESWEAVKDYGNEFHKSYDFYRPFNDSEFARICSVKQAVAKGAKVIVMPGFKFAGTCRSVMNKYPNVNFILLDTNVDIDDKNPVDPTKNVCCVGFKCEYSGFIAGYTTSQDLLMRDWEEAECKIDSMPKTYGYGYAGGMPSDGVYQFGFGYIQGICKGMADFFKNIAKVTDTNKWPKIVIKYLYAFAFAQHDPTAIKVKSWYADEADNIKVVFPCGGKLYQSITEAAQHYNKHQSKFNCDAWFEGKLDRNPRTAARWIGVDSDQYIGLKQAHEKASIYTSALKGLKTTITKALDFHYADEWYRIGGVHGRGEEGKVPGGGIMKNRKWVLGLNSVFGEFDEEKEKEEIKKAKGNFVGIPLEYNEETGIMRGFDKYTYDDVSNLYDHLILDVGAIQVYGKDGTEYGSEFGYPNNMVKWDNGNFRKKYLGDYPETKIGLEVI